ncbi:MAG: DUF1631 family protein, partial [Rubrivivax sp.]|nr:DUF1631 family protein [Rubrivivax sp.]
MKVPTHRRLPAQLEAAAHRLKLAVRSAVDRTVESLGLSALSAPNLVRRDDLLAAQFELNRKSAVFTLAFNEAMDEWIAREAQAPGEHAAKATTNWDSLALVDDQEVERKISAERFALDVATGCEWELRELDGYIGSLLGQEGETAVRNPLRPEVVGHAVIKGVAAVSERPEVRKVLQAEISRSIAGDLRATYADIVARLRNAGVQPLSLAVRQRQQRAAAGGAGEAGRAATEFDTLGRPLDPALGGPGGHGHDDGGEGAGFFGGPGGHSGHGGAGGHGRGPGSRHGSSYGGTGYGGYAGGGVA